MLCEFHELAVSPDNKFVEILEYFHNTVLQASC